MPTKEQLRNILERIDGRGYKAYKDLRGHYDFGRFTLHIDYVQGDPFASPSRLRVEIPQESAGYPLDTYRYKTRAVALCTYLADQFAQEASAASARRGSGRSGIIEIDQPGQQMIERTCLRVDDRRVEARFFVGLPAAGRRVLGKHAATLLCEDVPHIVEASLFYNLKDADEIGRHIRAAEDAEALRAHLADRELVAFVADGSALPRRSGVDDHPLQEGVVPFVSPEELRVDFTLPHAGHVSGMGIPRGVTLIAGGGFHGKSTLLNTIARGVYNHRPGDGRELAVSDETCVKIRAEDGRSIAGVDISPFINNLPFERNTHSFYSENASGSTSQAANVVEALEAGARVLLIDEDTAATNFMVRDRRMRDLVADENEPITPLVDRVRTLYEQHGVSTVLVVGGSGDYFATADTVVVMDSYRPREATAQAKEIAAVYEFLYPNRRDEPLSFARRIPDRDSIDPRRGQREQSARARGLKTVLFGEAQIDLGAVEQLVDPSQTRALSAALLYAREKYADGKHSLREILGCVMHDIEEQGLDVLDRRHMGDLARFRSFELAAAINRLRGLKVDTAS